jgi:hypothetical protein
MRLGQQMPRVARNNTPSAVYAEQDAQRKMTQPLTTTGKSASVLWPSSCSPPRWNCEERRGGLSLFEPAWAPSAD